MEVGFLRVRAAFCEVVCEAKKYGEDLASFPVTEMMTGNVIYGEGGWARYIVRNDGEIVLDAGSTRPTRAEEARAAGFTVR